jgi:hypothetical protein
MLRSLTTRSVAIRPLGGVTPIYAASTGPYGIGMATRGIAVSSATAMRIVGVPTTRRSTTSSSSMSSMSSTTTTSNNTNTRSMIGMSANMIRGMATSKPNPKAEAAAAAAEAKAAKLAADKVAAEKAEIEAQAEWERQDALPLEQADSHIKMVRNVSCIYLSSISLPSICFYMSSCVRLCTYFTYYRLVLAHI